MASDWKELNAIFVGRGSLKYLRLVITLEDIENFVDKGRVDSPTPEKTKKHCIHGQCRHHGRTGYPRLQNFRHEVRRRCTRCLTYHFARPTRKGWLPVVLVAAGITAIGPGKLFERDRLIQVLQPRPTNIAWRAWNHVRSYLSAFPRQFSRNGSVLEDRTILKHDVPLLVVRGPGMHNINPNFQPTHSLNQCNSIKIPSNGAH